MHARSQPYQLNQAGDAHAGLFEDIQTRDNQSVRMGQAAGKYSTGSFNVFSGYEAGKESTTASYGTYIGFQAGFYAGPTAIANTYVGALCGKGAAAGTRAQETVGVGFGCLEASRDQKQSVYIGAYSGREAASTFKSVAIGYRAAERTLDGIENVYIGSEVAQDARSGHRNCAIGFQSFRANFLGGSENVAVGAYSGYSNFGSGNSYIGYRCGEYGSPSDASYNTALGAYALQTVAGGSNCVIGYGAEGLGTSNSAFGMQAIANGDGHCVVGMNAQTYGYGNTVIGSDAAAGSLSIDSNATLNVSIGHKTMKFGGGIGNVVAGAEGGQYVTGDFNTLIAYNVGQSLKTGSCNVFVGVGADAYNPDTDNAIVIGTTGVFGTNETISIGQSIENKRPKSTLIGYDIVSDADNTIVIGTQVSVESVSFYRDPLIYSFVDAVFSDAVSKYGVSNIDYGTLLLNPSGTPNNNATIGRFTSNTINSSQYTRKGYPEKSLSYSLLDAVPGYFIHQGLVLPVLDQPTSSVLQLPSILDVFNRSPNIDVSCNVPNVTYTSNVEKIDMSWEAQNSSLGIVTNVFQTQQSNAQIPIYVPKQSRYPIVATATVQQTNVPITDVVSNLVNSQEGLLVNLSVANSLTYSQNGVTPNENDKQMFYISEFPMFGRVDKSTIDAGSGVNIEYVYTSYRTSAFATSDTMRLTPVLQKVDPNNSYVYGVMGSNDITVNMTFTGSQVAYTDMVYTNQSNILFQPSFVVQIPNRTKPEPLNITSLSSNLSLKYNNIKYTSNDIDTMVSCNIYEYPSSALPTYISQLGVSKNEVFHKFQEASSKYLFTSQNLNAGEGIFSSIETNLSSLSTLVSLSNLSSAASLSNLSVTIDKFVSASNNLGWITTLSSQSYNIGAWTDFVSAFNNWQSSTNSYYKTSDESVQIGSSVESFNNIYNASGTQNLLTKFNTFASSVTLSNLTSASTLNASAETKTALLAIKKGGIYGALSEGLTSNIDEYQIKYEKTRKAYNGDIPRLFMSYTDVISNSIQLQVSDPAIKTTVKGELGGNLFSFDLSPTEEAEYRRPITVTYDVRCSLSNLFDKIELPLHSVPAQSSNYLKDFPKYGKATLSSVNNSLLQYSVTDPFTKYTKDQLAYVSVDTSTPASSSKSALTRFELIRQPTLLSLPIIAPVFLLDTILAESNIFIESKETARTTLSNIKSITMNSCNILVVDGIKLSTTEHLGGQLPNIITPILNYSSKPYQQVVSSNVFETTTTSLTNIDTTASYQATATIANATSNITETYSYSFVDKTWILTTDPITVSYGSPEVGNINGSVSSNILIDTKYFITQSNIPILTTVTSNMDTWVYEFQVVDAFNTDLLTSNVSKEYSPVIVQPQPYVSTEPATISIRETYKMFSKIKTHKPYSQLSVANLRLVGSESESDRITFSRTSEQAVDTFVDVRTHTNLSNFTQKDVEGGYIYTQGPFPGVNTPIGYVSLSVNEFTVNTSSAPLTVTPCTPVTVSISSSSPFIPLSNIITIPTTDPSVSSVVSMFGSNVWLELNETTTAVSQTMTNIATVVNGKVSGKYKYHVPPFCKTDTLKYATLSNNVIVGVYEQDVVFDRSVVNLTLDGVNINVGLDSGRCLLDPQQFDIGATDPTFSVVAGGAVQVETNAVLEVRVNDSISTTFTLENIRAGVVSLSLGEGEISSSTSLKFFEGGLETTIYSLNVHPFVHHQFPFAEAAPSLVFEKFGYTNTISNRTPDNIRDKFWESLSTYRIRGSQTVPSSNILFAMDQAPYKGILWNEKPVQTISLQDVKHNKVEYIPYDPTLIALDNDSAVLRVVLPFQDKLICSTPITINLKNYVAPFHNSSYDPTQASANRAPIHPPTPSMGLIQDGYQWIGVGAGILPLHQPFVSSSIEEYTFALSNTSTGGQIYSGASRYSPIAKTSRLQVGGSNQSVEWNSSTLQIELDQSDRTILSNLGQHVRYDATLTSTVYFYVQNNSLEGIVLDTLSPGTARPRFTLEEALRGTIIYQHLGHTTDVHEIKIYVSTHPYDLNPSPCTVKFMIRKLPTFVNNIDYVYYPTKQTASNSIRLLSNSLVASTDDADIMSSTWVHLLSNSNAQFVSSISGPTEQSKYNDAGYKIMDYVYNNNLIRTTPYESLNFVLSVNRTSNQVNPLYTNPIYKDLFTFNWFGELNKFEDSNIIEYPYWPDIQGLEYIFDTSDPKHNDLSNRVVTIGYKVKPSSQLVYPIGSEASKQIAPFHTFSYTLEANDNNDETVLSLNFTQSNVTLRSSNSPGILTIQLTEKTEPMFESYQLVEIFNVDSDNNDYSSIYVGYNRSQSRIENKPQNILYGSNISFDFQQMAYLRLQADTTGAKNIYTQVHDTRTAIASSSTPSNQLLQMSYDFANAGTTLFLKDLEISSSTYTLIGSTTTIDTVHNLVMGKDILVRGVNNICFGTNFTTSGIKSIIIGNEIGNSQDENTVNDIYQCIVIGNDSFRNSIIRDVISIGNDNLNDLYQAPVDKVNFFLSKKPIIVGNSIDKSTLDYHINIGNTFLRTSIEGEKIMLGINGEQVGIGYSNHTDMSAASNSNSAVLHVQGTIQVNGSIATTGYLRDQQGVYPFKGCQTVLMSTAFSASNFDGTVMVNTGEMLKEKLVVAPSSSEKSTAVYGVSTGVVINSNIVIPTKGTFNEILVTTNGETFVNLDASFMGDAIIPRGCYLVSSVDGTAMLQDVAIKGNETATPDAVYNYTIGKVLYYVRVVGVPNGVPRSPNRAKVSLCI